MKYSKLLFAVRVEKYTNVLRIGGWTYMLFNAILETLYLSICVLIRVLEGEDH